LKRLVKIEKSVSGFDIGVSMDQRGTILIVQTELFGYSLKLLQKARHILGRELRLNVL
jgi:hypothetical protein